MQGALAGFRILDISQNLAGPFGGMFLGDMGAEVIKVEPPVGDSVRRTPPYFYGDDSAYFWSVNRNKKSVVIDLKNPQGLKVFYDLVSRADVVFESFSPGVSERLKVDYKDLKVINPRIVYCSVSTFGHTSPYRDRPGYDLIVQAMSGGMSITGEPGREPVRAGIPIGDLMGGTLAVNGILAALLARERTGQGRKIDVALLDGQLCLLTYIGQYFLHSGKIPGPIGSGHQSNVIYGALKTKDIRIVVVAHSDQYFARLCQALGKPEWAGDERFATRAARLKNKPLLTSMIEDILQTRTGDEWLKKLHEYEVPAGPINTLDRILNDPHLPARGMIVEVEGRSGEKVKMVGNPFTRSDMVVEKFTPPPKLGEHTREVLSGLLGYSPEKIDLLAKDGAIRTL